MTPRGNIYLHIVFSAPLEHLVEVGQVGDLQHAPVLAEALRRREEAAERLEHGVLHLPAPRARLAIRLQTTHARHRVIDNKQPSELSVPPSLSTEEHKE